MTTKQHNPLDLLTSIINTLAVFNEQHENVDHSLSILLDDGADSLGIPESELEDIFACHAIDSRAWDQVRDQVMDIYRRCLALREELQDAQARHTSTNGGDR